MKKTVQTVLTATMFAVALGTMPSGTAETSSATDYNPAMDEWQGVYGPPPVTTTLAETTYAQPVYGTYPYWETTPVETVTTAFNPEQMTTVAVYGPPIAWGTTTAPVPETVPTTMAVPVPVYGPPTAWLGDVDGDGRIDVFDMIELRKAYISGLTENSWIDFYRADINKDGEIGVADLVMLQNYLLGNIENFDNRITELHGTVSTEPPKSYADTTTTAIVPSETEPVPECVYGPPVAFE